MTYPLTHLLTGVKCRATSVAKNLISYTNENLMDFRGKPGFGNFTKLLEREPSYDQSKYTVQLVFSRN